MRVKQWNAGELPGTAASVLCVVLRDGRGNDDELAISLDLAALGRSLTPIASDGGLPVGVQVTEPEPRIQSAYVQVLALEPDARGSGAQQP